MHPQSWIRLIELPQGYQRSKILFEIVSILETLIVIDKNTKNRCFGHLLVSWLILISLRKLFKIYQWKGQCHAFNVEVVNEKQPLYSANCSKIGHNLHQYNKIITNQDMLTKCSFLSLMKVLGLLMCLSIRLILLLLQRVLPIIRMVLLESVLFVPLWVKKYNYIKTGNFRNLDQIEETSPLRGESGFS